MSNGDSTNKTESRLTVLDAGPIIHLDELDCLDLLEEIPEKSTLHISRDLLKRVVRELG